MRHGRWTIPTIALFVSAAGAQPVGATPGASGTNEPELPSLDDLLGLDTDGAGDPDDRDLQRQLSAREAGERFEQAVGLMGDASDRLASGDVSVATQRVQEDILRKLDQVIESAKQNQSQSGSSSSSSSSSRQQQQPKQSSQSGQQPGEPGSEPGESNMPGSNRDARPGAEIAPDGVGWGNLPERERDAVSQGVSDRYSALYRRLTELYYRKLAEREGEE